MRINQNIAAFNAYRNLTNTQSQQASSLEKLSSGFRINRAADDASGLVNSENLRSQIGGLKVATRNAQDAISLVQTAEGAQTEVHSILQRMRDLTVQSGNLGTNDTAALKANQDELNELVAELDRIADQTQFGTKKIFDGTFTTEGGPSTDVAVANQVTDTGTDATDASTVTFDYADIARPSSGSYTLTVDGETTGEIAFDADADAVATALSALTGLTATNTGGSIEVSKATSADVLEVTGTTVASEVTGGAVFQVGANENQTVRVGITGVDAGTLLVNGLNIGEDADEASIAAAIEAIDGAIGTVSENRATLGAFQNRMESTIRNVGVAVENLSAAESRIRDTDMAQEMVEFTRSQILSQAGTAMLAQANMVPQSVLQLLG